MKGGFNGEYEQSSIDHIYAVGDCLDGIPELTPIAQQSGKFLATRIDLAKVRLQNIDSAINVFRMVKQIPQLTSVIKWTIRTFQPQSLHL